MPRPVRTLPAPKLGNAGGRVKKTYDTNVMLFEKTLYALFK